MLTGNREAILRRSVAVIAVNTIAYVLRYWLAVTVEPGLELHELLITALRAAGIIGILFLGPIVYSLHRPRYVVCIHLVPLCSLSSLRTVVIAPVAEELFFRGAIFDFLVFSEWGRVSSAMLSSVLFGLAHCHHLFDSEFTRQNALVCVRQMAMTSVFGLLASWFRLADKTVISPIIAHSVANFLGAPDIQTMRNDVNHRGYEVLTVVGIVLFAIQLWYRS